MISLTWGSKQKATNEQAKQTHSQTQTTERWSPEGKDQEGKGDQLFGDGRSLGFWR